MSLDAHAGIEEKRLFFAQNEIGNGFFRLMRFVNGEDLRNNLVDFEQGSVDRYTFQSSIFGTREPRGTTRVGRVGPAVR